MGWRTAAVGLAAAGLCGCTQTSELRLARADAPAPPVLTRAPCAARGDCASVNRRQFYDAEAGRYYWRDPRTGRLHWENGAPKP